MNIIEDGWKDRLNRLNGWFLLLCGVHLVLASVLVYAEYSAASPYGRIVQRQVLHPDTPWFWYSLVATAIGLFLFQGRKGILAFGLVVYAAYHSLLGPGCVLWRGEGYCMALYIGTSDGVSVEEALALLEMTQDADVSAIIAEDATFHRGRIFFLLASTWAPVLWYLDMLTDDFISARKARKDLPSPRS